MKTTQRRNVTLGTLRGRQTMRKTFRPCERLLAKCKAGVVVQTELLPMLEANTEPLAVELSHAPDPIGTWVKILLRGTRIPSGTRSFGSRASPRSGAHAAPH
jgi:hypothetical protein